AGEHLGLKVTSGQFEYTLNRLYNERSRKGLLAVHRLDDAIRQAMRVRMVTHNFFEDVADWQASHRAPHRRLPPPVQWPDTGCAELRKLATAIRHGAEAIEQEEQRIELTAAQERCEALAASLTSWMEQGEAESVYWIEVAGGSRRRVSLSSAPLDVGP